MASLLGRLRCGNVDVTAEAGGCVRARTTFLAWFRVRVRVCVRETYSAAWESAEDGPFYRHQAAVFLFRRSSTVEGP